MHAVSLVAFCDCMRSRHRRVNSVHQNVGLKDKVRIGWELGLVMDR
jgi:hypothetical protein